MAQILLQGKHHGLSLLRRRSALFIFSTHGVRLDSSTRSPELLVMLLGVAKAGAIQSNALELLCAGTAALR
jgi:hypothetical protein